MIKPAYKNLLLAAALTAFLPAHSADDKNAGRAQLKQAQQAQRKLEQEKTQLAQEKTDLETQLKQAKESLGTAKATTDGASRRNSALQKELELAASEKTALAIKINELEKQLEESEKKAAASIEERHNVELAKAQVDANLSQRDQTLLACETKNQAQYKAGVELLNKYQHKSCFKSLMQSEPLFGFGQTSLENEVEGEREKIEKQHLEQKKEVLISP